MLVPEFYLRGWGERRAGSGGVFGDPQGPLWCVGWAGETGSWAGAKRGVLGGSERPRLKAWLPLNSGLFGIQLQGQFIWGQGQEGAAL